MKNQSKTWRRYINFKGRSNREEYWSFITSYLLFYGLTYLSDHWIADGYYFINDIYIIVTLIPFLAITTKRLHDTGHSGWTALALLCLGILGLIWLLLYLIKKGEQGLNAYNETSDS